VGWSGSRGSGFYLCWLQEEVSTGRLRGWAGVVPEDQDFTSVGSRRKFPMEGSRGGLEWFQRIRILPLLAPGGVPLFKKLRDIIFFVGQ
jgi:hypothetical protein